MARARAAARARALSACSTNSVWVVGSSALRARPAVRASAVVVIAVVAQHLRRASSIRMEASAATAADWEGIAPILHKHFDVTSTPEVSMVVGNRTEDMQKFIHDYCGRPLDEFHHSRVATPFDHSMHKLFVHLTLRPMDKFAAILSQLCNIQQTRDSLGRHIAEECKSPKMVGVLKKTVRAMNKFRSLREDWSRWMNLVDIHDLDDIDHEQKISLLERATPSQRSALARFTEQSTKFGLRIKSRLGVPGWKRLLVALLLQTPDSKVLWTKHKDDLLNQIRAQDIQITFRQGEPPQLHASHAFLQHCFSEEEMHAFEAIQTIEDEDEAGHPIQATEDLADTTLAIASRLGDALSHFKLGSELLRETRGINEARSLFSGAESIVNGRFEPMKLLGVGAALTDELLGHQLGPLGELTLVQDILGLAQTSDELQASIQILQECMTWANIGEGIGADLLPNLLDESHAVEVAKGAADVACESCKTKVFIGMVKGSNAMLKLASLWSRLPSDVCHRFEPLIDTMHHVGFAGLF